MNFEQSIVVRTPLKEVFNYLSNLRNQQEFRVDLKAGIESNSTLAALGTKYIERSKFLGLKWKRNFEVTTLIPERQIVTKSVLGWLPLEQQFRLKKVQDGTRIDWKIKMNPKGIFKLMKPYIKVQMKKQFSTNTNLLKETLDFKLSNAFFLTYTNSNSKNWL